jgi:hypothetical protein
VFNACTYPLAQGEIMLLEVPVIDIEPFRSGDPARRRTVAQAAGQAVSDIGFLVITGHGVDPDLIAGCKRPHGHSSTCPWRKSGSSFWTSSKRRFWLQVCRRRPGRVPRHPNWSSLHLPRL